MREVKPRGAAAAFQMERPRRRFQELEKMPSPSAARPRGSIIRQLSLQGQQSAQPAAGRRGLRKQLSEDDPRGRIGSVEITGQGWSVGAERPEAGLRVDGKSGQAKTATAARPRPVKLAWADRRQDSAEGPTGVEVVARKCQGQPRPTKAHRIANLPLLGEKESLVYTKQQLAERLRIAWRERERNRPTNLNIFLTQAAETARSGNEEADASSARSGVAPQTEILIQDSVTFRSLSASESCLSCGTEPFAVRGAQRENPPVVRFSTPENPPAARVGPEAEPKSILKNVHSASDSPDFKTFPVGESSNAFGRKLTNLNYRMKSLDVVAREEAACAEENSDASPRSDSGYSENSKTGKPTEPEEEPPGRTLAVEDEDVRCHGTAQERRASFRSASLLNKAVDESNSPPGSSDEADEDVLEETANEIKVFLKKNEEKRPPLTRTFSAPTRNDAVVPKQTSPKTGTAGKPLLRFATSVDLFGGDEDPGQKGRIKSAPIRRKLKTGPVRRKHRGKEVDSSDDEKPPAESKKKASRRKAKLNPGDIVTMVSLVSPATSDVEETVPEESWPASEKEEPPEKADEADDSAGQPKEISSFIIQKFVSLRKSNKTVSFVQHPPINRSYSASFPSRRAPAGTPIIIPTPVVTNPALTPAQLQEREKRPPGTGDSRSGKRRLVRTASAPQVKGRSEEAGTGETGGRAEEPSDRLQRKEIGERIEERTEEEGEEPREPEFKTPKEKECWLLYQKMLEKGVAVSFDTVLRGMLTPTEYRLRRNQLLSGC